jgi:hypothetical protein
MQNSLPWVIALASGFGLLSLALIWSLRRPTAASKPLPLEWSLTARPVFSADERRVYRLLKEALPQHAILSKLPLVRFCQPTETSEVRYWFDLLGAIHVSFAICSPNGRVLAALDLESERSVSGRSAQIKQSVLSACRVRYLRCPADKLPSIAELQLLVPFSNSQSRSPQPAPAAKFSRAPEAPRRPRIDNHTPRRAGGAPAEPNRLWQDSGMFRDSFFAQDRQFSTSAPGTFVDSDMFDSLLDNEAIDPLDHEDFDDRADAPDDIVGVVVDSPRYRDADSPRSMSGRRSR